MKELPWDWAVYLAAWAVGIFVLCCMGWLIVAWLLPKEKRIVEGKPRGRLVLKTGYRWCCPPGLGCNDSYRNRPCRREVALRLADLEETHRLDELWTRLHAAPSAAALDTWARTRDDLIELKTRELVGEGGKVALGLVTVDRTKELTRGDISAL